MPESAKVAQSADGAGTADRAHGWARTLFLGSLGALAMTSDETRALLNRLVEKGEIIEDASRRRFTEVAGRVRAGGEKSMALSNKTTARSMDEVLSRISMPTRGDVESLGRKLNALAQQIEELRTKINA